VRGLALGQRVVELQLLRRIELELRLQGGDYRQRIGTVTPMRAGCPRRRGEPAKRGGGKRGNQRAFHDAISSGLFSLCPMSGCERRRL